MKILTICAMLACLALPATAQVLDFGAARKVVIDTKKTVAIIADASFLAEKEQGILKGLRETIPFYGALALSPSEGLYVEWLNASAQFHSRETARAAAMAMLRDYYKRAIGLAHSCALHAAIRLVPACGVKSSQPLRALLACRSFRL